MTIREYDYYLFDADGTLFDTTAMIVRCFQHTAQVLGFEPVAPAEIVRRIGMTLRKQMECYFGAMSTENFERARAIHMEFQLSIYKEHLKLCPGVAVALAELTTRGKRCAVVTSRMLATLEIYLKETGILPFFSALVTPECTIKHKPEPEPALEALARLGGTAAQALFIGDATFDIACGKQAGMDTAFVLWSHTAAESLTVVPTYTVTDMRELCSW